MICKHCGLAIHKCSSADEYHADDRTEYMKELNGAGCVHEPILLAPIDICALYEELPLSEKTLLRRMRKGRYPMLRNDRGGACDYYIYDGDNPVPVGVVVYRRQRKLVIHGISTPAEADRPVQSAPEKGTFRCSQ